MAILVFAGFTGLAGGAAALQSGNDNGKGEGGAPDFVIDWATIDSGGGMSSASDIRMLGVIGQPDAANLAAGPFELRGGFLPAAGGERPPCPADLDGNQSVGFEDLLAVLSSWGVCAGCPADLNGDGVVAFDDLLATLSAWGPCP